MKFIKAATSSALIAALSLSVGCASKPDSQALVEDPSQNVAAAGPDTDSSDLNSAEIDTAKISSNEQAAQTVSETSTPSSSNDEPAQKAASAEKANAAVDAKVKSKADSQPEAQVAVQVTDQVANGAATEAGKTKSQAAKAEESVKASSQKKEKVAAAQAQQKVKVSKKSLENALDVSSKDLPVTMDIWTLRESFQPGEGLVLSTPTLQMGDGDYLSQIRLTLTPDQLVIDSSSDIDTNLKGTGVRYNGGDIIPLDRMEGSTVGIVEGDWMGRFAEGGKIEIFLGFFPDKIKDSPVFSKEASINALSKLVPTYYKLQ